MSLYLKTIDCSGFKRIVLQNENGPCPLLAIVNVFALLEVPEFTSFLVKKKSITTQDLVQWLIEYASDRGDVAALMPFVHNLTEGLDVNPIFNGGFVESKELDLFKIFGIRLVHCWVIDELEFYGFMDDKDLASGLAHLAQARDMNYDEFCKDQFNPTADNEEALSMLARFVRTYPTQVTQSGIEHLKKQMDNGEIAVLFRNNHFATLTRQDETLFTLVTDEGYGNHPDIVWETMKTINGQEEFYTGNFRKCEQVDTSKDEELARKLQERERLNQTEGTKSQTQQTHQHTSKLRDSGEKAKKKDKCAVM